MGFYGNITNTSRTTFQFDHVYPSRAEMEKEMAQDGDDVYIGRYVLIEYDPEVTNKDYKQAYLGTDGNLYASINCEANTRIRFVEDETINPKEILYGVSLATVVYVYNGFKQEYTYYECIGEEEGYAKFKVVEGAHRPDSVGEYARNYDADKAWAKARGVSFGRGWDSTVWQKTFVNGVEKYVMIAELNTVVPTFDITADAPSITPLTPHFDEKSTDVYYKLHWQPQWGLRVKANKSDLTGPVLDKNGQETSVVYNDPDGNKQSRTITPMSTDTVNYPSDDTTVWSKYEYDTMTAKETKKSYNPTTSTWEDASEPASVDAAVYWNKAGFDPEYITYSADLLDRNNKNYNEEVAASWTDGDRIQLAPTGQSGHTYEKHSGDYTYGNDIDVREDTQELSIMLPSIGNSIAQMWDIVYGGRDTNNKIKHTNERNTDIAWEDALNTPKREGLRLVREQYVEASPPDETDLVGKYYIINDETGDYELVDSNYVGSGPYYIKGNGFTLKTEEVNTLAGCINSVHDLMGMIIVDEQDVGVNPDSYPNIEELDGSKIYYFTSDGSYRYRKEDYTYEEIAYRFEEVPELNELTYAPNIYYIKDNTGKYIPDLNNTFDSTQQYFRKVSDDEANETYIPIDLVAFSTGNYYKDPDGSYRFNDNLAPEEGVTYYDIVRNTDVVEGQKFEKAYVGNKFYYKQKNGNYYNFALDTRNGTTYKRRYYDIEEDQLHPTTVELRDFMRYDVETGLYLDDNYSQPVELEYYFSPGKFYYKEWTDALHETYEWKSETDSTLPHAEEGYYLLDQSMKQSIETSEWVPVLTGDDTYYKVKLKLLTDSDEVYYYATEEHVYARLDQRGLDAIQASLGIRPFGGNDPSLANPVVFYTIDGITDADGYDGLYEPNRYSRKIGNSFIVSSSKEPDPNETYYMTHELITGENISDYSDYIVFSEIKDIFYIPNKYYYYNDEYNRYMLSKDIDFEAHDQYYTSEDFYVLGDAAGVYPQGSVWNTNVTTIPCTVAIAKRTTHYVLERLIGFARNLNTIHGLILEINQLLSLGDYRTRDRNTVQGSINVINDIINSFGELEPRQFSIVDTHGRINSAPWTSKQALEYTNIGKPSASGAKAAEENKWISVNINPDPIEPLVEFSHRFNPVADTTTAANKNNDSGTVLDGLNKNHGDTINLYTPIVDNTGHVIGKNTETVTLPYGFKNINVNNNTTVGDNTSAWNGAIDAQATVIADNTQDTLNINSENKWIRLKNNAANDTITIAHETHPVTPTTSTASLVKTTTGTTTFDVLTYEFDNAGHYNGKDTKTITMPNSYGKFTGDAGSTEADCTHDTLAMTGDSWIKTTLSNDKIELSHIGPVDVAKRNPENVTPLFGETFTIEDWRYDEHGHKAGVETHTVKIPQGSLIQQTEKTNANVLTEISFTPSTGETKVNRTNVGSLVLTGYGVNDLSGQPYSGALDARDSINVAFAKLNNDLIVEKGKITTLIGDDTNKSVRKIANEELVKQLIPQGAKESLDTLKEIAEWIQQHPDDVATMNAAIQANAIAISNEIERAGGIESELRTDVNELQGLALPNHDALTTNGVYVIKKTASGLEWVEISNWAGGEY